MSAADLLRIRRAEQEARKIFDNVEGLRLVEFTATDTPDQSMLWAKLSSTELRGDRRLNEPFDDRDAAAWLADVAREIERSSTWLISLGGYAQLGWARVRSEAEAERWLPGLLGALTSKDVILVDESRGAAYGFSDDEDGLIFARLR